MNNYFMRFPYGKTKAVTFSYDDGCTADMRLVQTLNRYGIKCTFNIPSRFLNTDGHLTTDEVLQHIVGKGHEVAVHCANHKSPGMASAVDGVKDVLECRQELERMFDIIVRGMAYPNSGILHFENGLKYSDVKQYLKYLGIEYSRSLGGDNDTFYMPEDWYNWVPTAHHNNPAVLGFIDEFVKFDVNSLYEGKQWPRLFYLWGHSYEFENSGNWEHLDNICKKISVLDDVWYATNIEIFDYTEAYQSLIFNVDRTTVYNPSLYTVWFRADGKDYSVASGETLKLS